MDTNTQALLLTVLWTASCLVGLGAAIWNRRDAGKDLAELDPVVDNGRRDYAEGWTRRENLRILMQALGLLAVVVALLDGGIWVSAVLVLLQVTVTVNTVLDYRQRKRINKNLGIRQ